MPLSVKLFGLNNRELPIEKDIEPVDTGAKKFGKKEVSQLVGDNQEGKADKKYQCFHSVILQL